MMETKRIVSIDVVKAGSSPDVDSDIRTDARDSAIEHVAEVHGHDNVANIITFTTLAAKGAFKTLCTIHDVPFASATKISNLVPPPIEGVEVKLKDIFNPAHERYDEGKDFRDAVSTEEWQRVLTGAQALEGRIKAYGVHACGIIMSSKPLEETIPLWVRSGDHRVVTQWTYPECESLGLIKFDFLGLDTVDLIQYTVEYIMKNGKTPPNMVDLIHGEMDDKKTYSTVFSSGQTIGIFQFGSDLVSGFCKKMMPETFEDLAATTALCRPGPMGMQSHFSYAARKNGQEPVAPLHPDFANSPLEEILAPTYGLCVPVGTPLLDATTGLYKPIESFRAGQDATASYGATGTVEAKLVKHVVKTGVKPLVEVRLNNGRTLRVSTTHPVLTRRGYVPAGELTSQDSVVVTAQPIDVATTPTMSEEEAYTLGISLARAMETPSLALEEEKVLANPNSILRQVIAGWCDAHRATEEAPEKAPLSLTSATTSLHTMLKHLLWRLGVDFSEQITDRGRPTVLLQPHHFYTHLFPHCRSKLWQKDLEKLSLPSTLPSSLVTHNVAAVVPCGEELCYDIEVDTNHNFVVEGVVVHNCVYQEQIMKIANQLAGFTLQEGDDLRSAMGKKKREKMAKMKPHFLEGGVERGYSLEAMNILWDTIAEFAKYGFNRCAHGDTVVYDAHNRKIRLRELHKRWAAGERDIELLSLWEDGSIRPHKVRDVVYTGRKPVYEVKTASGRSIKITKEHRLLTTTGYGTIEDGTLAVGMELMVDEADRGFGVTPEERQRRAARLTAYNRSEAGRKKAAATMRATQASITYEERCEHQRRVQELHPERTLPWQKVALEKLEQLRKDPVWVKNFAESLAQREREGFRGFGKMTRISDGRTCDSIIEAAAAEYLLARGVEFELHKVIENPTTGFCRISDFYAEGLYFEMDGLQRGEQWFRDHKYGDVPFIYLTPYNFVDRIEEALATRHAHNGDPIVSITKFSKNDQKVYDVEMELEGPSNFIADGIVSHNSHSVAYAMNAYSSAYLKTHYPVEFMAALLAQNVGNKDKILMFLQEARRMGLKVGATDINFSDVRVAPDYSGRSTYDILFGLSGVDAISQEVASIIVEEREAHGAYSSVKDLIDRCSPLGVTNRKVYENLALAGAFDSFAHPRKTIVDNLPALLGDAKTKAAQGESLFDLFGGDDTASDLSVDLSQGEDYPFVEKLKFEAGVMGLYLTAHPLSRAGSGLAQAKVVKLDKLLQANKMITVNVVGALTEIKEKRARRGGKTVTVVVDDGTSYLTAALSRDLIKGMDKGKAQQRLLRFYTTGETSALEEVVKATLKEAVDEEFKVVEELEKNGLYLMNITFKPARGDMPHGARINSIRPFHLSHGGELPLRIRAEVKNESQVKAAEAKLRKIGKELAQRFPGPYPLQGAVVTPTLKKPLQEENKWFRGVAKEIIARPPVEATGSKKAKDELPPPPRPRDVTAPDMSEAELAESLTYADLGVKVDKCPQVEEFLSSKFGAERVDYGVFNSSFEE